MSPKPDVFDWKRSRGYSTPVLAHSDLTALSRLPKISLRLETNTESHGDTDLARVTATNASSALAFFVHLRVLKGNGGPELLPTFWTENYFELLPGESREVSATYSHKELGNLQPDIAVDGWNITPAEVDPKVKTIVRRQ